MEITKIERTDANVDNSRYEVKVAEEVEDDYGNKVILYRKQVIGNLDTLLAQKADLEKSLQDINDKLTEIQKIEGQSIGEIKK